MVGSMDKSKGEELLGKEIGYRIDMKCINCNAAEAGERQNEGLWKRRTAYVQTPPTDLQPFQPEQINKKRRVEKERK